MRESLRLRGKFCCAVLLTAAACTFMNAAWSQQSENQHAEESPPPAIRMPLAIIENQGQTDPRVKFYLPGGRATVFFTPDEVVFKLVEPSTAGPEEKKGIEQAMAPRQGVVIRMSFPGANPQVRLEAIDPLPGRINELRGNDPKNWRQDIATFAGVVYRDLYPGIDLEYRTDSGELRRKLVVRDRRQLDKFQLRYVGTNELRLGDKGLLELVTPVGTIQEAPIAAVGPDKAETVPALRYAVLGSDTVGLIQQ
ncbi:MAG: hypothetical protein RBU21_14105 [FCB group bacterium]|jgi:hypothetical protein|nr:hypothetical protein [FCB group bacterium]